jgi:hypothetical protein
MFYGNQPQEVAVELADEFENHAQYVAGIAYLTEEGWKVVSDKYGEVLPEMRASIFNDLCRELTRRGIEYDVSSFSMVGE